MEIYGGNLLFIIIKHNFVQPFFVADLGEVGDKIMKCFDNQKFRENVSQNYIKLNLII